MRVLTSKTWVISARGFTLIEVVMVLAILAILAGVVYPTYIESVRKGKRTEGRAALFLLLHQQERFYSQHNTYIAFSSSSTDDDGKKFKWFSGTSSKNSAYEIRAEACENDTIQNCVQLTAMPGTKNVGGNYQDPVCGNLKISSTGIKDAMHPDCWN